MATHAQARTNAYPLKRDKPIYWTTTAIVCAVMALSAINFLFFDRFPYPEGAFVHLGLPDYFKVELSVAKILGVAALLIPAVPRKLKEFAYFGFGLTLISASIAHFAVGDAVRPPFYVLSVIDPLLFFAALAVSYHYFNKLGGGERTPLGQR